MTRRLVQRTPLAKDQMLTLAHGSFLLCYFPCHIATPNLSEVVSSTNTAIISPGDAPTAKSPLKSSADGLDGRVRAHDPTTASKKQDVRTTTARRDASSSSNCQMTHRAFWQPCATLAGPCRLLAPGWARSSCRVPTRPPDPYLPRVAATRSFHRKQSQ